MNKRRLMALVAALCCLLSTTVYAGGGQILYDEGNGESLQGLLEEDVTAWPTVALPAQGDALSVKAKGAVLMDQGTGQVLYEQDAHVKLPIASVTKVMTLLLTLEAIEAGTVGWADKVTCSPTASAIGGSQIWLEPGEIMTVEELVKAAVVVSANDACGALAEYISGSQETFVAAMNRRAQQLGMENTQFKDCSGLDDTGYSTAHDVAVMSRELMTHKDIERFTTIWMDSLRGGASQLVNTNKLLRHYPGATGLKTGTTSAAGHCLSATARRDDTAFVAVVLGCASTADRWAGARTLLDYGFANYVTYTLPDGPPRPEPLTVKGGQQTQVAVEAQGPDALLIPKGREKEVTQTVELVTDLEAPVEKGQTVGIWRLFLGDEVLGEYPVRALRQVPCTTLPWAYGLLLDSLLA
ncbi:MAG: D-alanyl-D-alanine carboxypeptidase [Clostridia bacterium]|nr:D-alanyl-D-alanine carboxypeptidase [Clostridia bacterium]